MTGELIQSAADSGDLPICPMSMGAGRNTAHAIEVNFINRLYEAMKGFRDADGEFTDPAMDKLYSEVVYNKAYARMQLHLEGTQFMHRKQIHYVETYFYRCHLCGFVLPTQQESVVGR